MPDREHSTTSSDLQPFIQGLRRAWQQEQAGARIYRALAGHERSQARRQVLLKLAAAEEGHAERWAARLRELGVALPADHDPLPARLWRWMLVHSGTDNALQRIESSEDNDAERYAALAQLAPSDADRDAIQAVQHDEETHGRVTGQSGAAPAPANVAQGRLDAILGRERWHRRGGGWIGQAIYGANDGLGAVFGIVSGVAGATAGGPAVLIAGLAGMLASGLSMGSGAYLATKAEREVSEAEIARERWELEQNPQEELEELALFYQLKGVPEAEAQSLAARLISQPEHAVKTLASEELGLSELSFPNPWIAALSATLSTGLGAFIPIIPFFFTGGYPAIIASFGISTLAHFLIGAAKTVVTGLSPWRSGAEMMVVGLGEASITYMLGLMFRPVIGS
jgi:VIT1/CCC1 family predicted Fe2+/Mn2+ transporter/rubrerythrin